MKSNLEQPTERARPARARRGSTLLVTLMVTVILSLLGVAFLTMSEQENRISVNERDAKQAVYAAQIGAKLAVEWFQNPQPNANASWSNNVAWLPSRAQITFNAITGVSYKGGAGGADAAGNFLFDKSYRASAKDTFRGSEGATTADVVLTDVSTSSTNFLNLLNSTIRPTGAGTAINGSALGDTRITEIQVYAPPVVNAVRYGIATIKATATKFDSGGSAIATRSVYAVLNEIKFPAPKGPVNAKFSAAVGGNTQIHWGEELSYSNVSITYHNANSISSGFPWTTRSEAGGYGDFDATSDLRWQALQGLTLQGAQSKFRDPWFRVRTAGDIVQMSSVNAPTGGLPDTRCTDIVGDAVTGDSGPHDVLQDKGLWSYKCESPDQRQPFPWTGATTAALRLAAVSTDAPTNVSRWDNQVELPDIQYDVWKKVAQGRGKNIHYYIRNTSSDDLWQEDGYGTSKTLLNWTNILNPAGNAIISGKASIAFFDTDDKMNPQTRGCAATNYTCKSLTPAFNYNGNQGKVVGGFVYLNAQQFAVKAINPQEFPVPGPGETKGIAWKDVSPHKLVGGVDKLWVYAPCKANKAATVGMSSAAASTNPPCGTNVIDNGSTLTSGVTVNLTSTQLALLDAQATSGMWQFWDTSASVLKDETALADYDPTQDPSKPFTNFDYGDYGTGTTGTTNREADCCVGNQMQNTITINGDPTHSGMTWGVDKSGPDYNMDMDLYGVLFNEGGWGGGNGNAKIFGALIAYGAFDTSGTVDIFFDERIIKDMWPPADWKLPRVKVASWRAE